MMATKILYEDPKSPLDLMDTLAKDPSLIAAHVSLRKAPQWECEQEYRIPIGPKGNYPRLMPFPPDAIVEIRLGACIKPDFRKKIMSAISKLPTRPTVIQMNRASDRFVLTETVLTN